MDVTYLAELPADVQSLVTLIEGGCGIEVEVEVDETRAGKYPGEPDPLASSVTEYHASVIIPKQGYFPESSVLHELLHIRRFLVDRVPQIDVCEDRWHPDLESVFTRLDNMLEHLVIVPEEIHRRPARRERWIDVTNRQLAKVEASELGATDREVYSLYHWAFANHVLKDGTLTARIYATLRDLDLEGQAQSFLDSIRPALSSKEASIKIFVDHFHLPKELVCLNYLDPRRKQCRQEKLA